MIRYTFDVARPIPTLILFKDLKFCLFSEALEGLWVTQLEVTRQEGLKDDHSRILHSLTPAMSFPETFP